MQRHYILLVHLLLIHFSFFGQEFGTIGSTWYYSEHAGGFGPSNSEYVQLQSVSDTIIQGKSTHKIIRKYYQFNGDTVTFDPLFVYEQSDTAFYVQQ